MSTMCTVLSWYGQERYKSTHRQRGPGWQNQLSIMDGEAHGLKSQGGFIEEMDLKLTLYRWMGNKTQTGGDTTDTISMTSKMTIKLSKG